MSRMTLDEEEEVQDELAALQRENDALVRLCSLIHSVPHPLGSPMTQCVLLLRYDNTEGQGSSSTPIRTNHGPRSTGSGGFYSYDRSVFPDLFAT